MKKLPAKTHLLAVGIVLVIMSTIGCEEQNLSNTKKSRLIATENIQLKEQLTTRDMEIEHQKKLLGKCLQEKTALQQKTQKELEAKVNDVLVDVIEENAKLRQKIMDLKSQTKESKK